MIPQVAVFVDAGYLTTAAGHAACNMQAKSPVPRRLLRLHLERTIKAIVSESRELADQRPLLRVYWYDACPGGTRKTAEHDEIARTRDVKLRMGSMGRDGRQKGVDTMLVLDLVELAQNRAMSDAVVVSGDEDLREGIVRAQAQGVRVHLIGLSTAAEDEKQYNQSLEMLAAVDRHTLWPQETSASFVEILPDEQDGKQDVELAPEVLQKIQKAAEESAERVDLATIVAYRKTHQKGLPGDVDGRLLATARQHLGRDLVHEEKRTLRALHQSLLCTRIAHEHPEHYAADAACTAQEGADVLAAPETLAAGTPQDAVAPGLAATSGHGHEDAAAVDTTTGRGAETDGNAPNMSKADHTTDDQAAAEALA